MKKNISKTRQKELEFKFLYFKLQKLINKKVIISLKYEQLKQPEIILTLIKPLTVRIIEYANSNNLNYRITKSSDFRTMVENKISILTIHVLLLIRYELLIQSKRNLIIYDLLITKAMVCELLAIRLLREYKSFDRVNVLFVDPLKKFNTIELSVLSKSKKFLSQPIIIQILNKFYNGELMIDAKKEDDYHEQSPLINENISNYKYQKITLSKIHHRLINVPKYQSLVINLKNLFFTFLHISIILNQHTKGIPPAFLEIPYMLMGINFNYEFFMKIWYINNSFLKKIVWFYLDFFIVLLIDINLILKFFVILEKFDNKFYYEVFSLLSILIIPRNLSIFNNYRFFNLIILSFKNMFLNMIGLFFLFLSIIVGFYIAFISLNFNRSNYQIAFDLLQIFFGFTPAVWTNWDSYHNLGKFIQIMYLFMSQFIISSILAIVLSEVFSNVSVNIKEDFEYFRTVNLIIYFQTSKLSIKNFTKYPILVVIFIYESISSHFSHETDDKSFTFIDKEEFYNDQELMNLDNDDDSSVFIKSRKASSQNPFALQPVISNIVPSMASRRYSQVDNNQFVQSPVIGPSTTAAINSGNPSVPVGDTPGLLPVQSISTLGNFKSASTDSLFIDDILSKKYGSNLIKTRTKKEVDLSIIIDKLNNLEDKIDKFEHVNEQDVNQTILNDIENDSSSINLYNIVETSFDGQSINSEELSDDTY
ncbi:hypothetical protein CLIB1444_06S03642 [[Candida] jaroonii]|uniref:Uncharacterized protein n=1 Tax=[Candida] jaroonii TaxID=467808 RepID=A0ACA9Y8X9_9ASCO|nr:hypothetical protein CLIB1444_06S03642 [[Candida] jaroonii]